MENMNFTLNDSYPLSSQSSVTAMPFPVLASLNILQSVHNFSLFFRFDQVGIYVVMFLEILQTLIKVLIVFSILIIAFGLAFYILLSRVSSEVQYFLSINK